MAETWLLVLILFSTSGTPVISTIGFSSLINCEKARIQILIKLTERVEEEKKRQGKKFYRTDVSLCVEK